MSSPSHLTSNPAGSPKVTDTTPLPAGPSPEIAAKQVPGQSEGDFMRDLDKVTQQVKRPG